MDADTTQRFLAEWLIDELSKGSIGSEQEVLHHLDPGATTQPWISGHANNTRVPEYPVDPSRQAAHAVFGDNASRAGNLYFEQSAFAHADNVQPSNSFIGAQHFQPTGYGTACGTSQQNHAPLVTRTGRAADNINDLSMGLCSGSHTRSNSDASQSDLMSLPRCWEHGCNGRSFKSTRNYRRHLIEQRGLDSAVCSRCGASFSRKGNRDKHEKKCSKGKDGGSGLKV